MIGPFMSSILLPGPGMEECIVWVAEWSFVPVTLSPAPNRRKTSERSNVRLSMAGTSTSTVYLLMFAGCPSTAEVRVLPSVTYILLKPICQSSFTWFLLVFIFFFSLSLLPVLMKDRCKLFCRVAGSTAYYQLRDRVIDGTPCGPDTNDICVQGLCRVIFLTLNFRTLKMHLGQLLRGVDIITS